MRYRNVVATCVATALTLGTIVAAASASAFPLDVLFTPVSLNGEDFYAPERQTSRWLLADRWPSAKPPRPPTFRVHYNESQQEYIGRASSGCRGWSMKIDLLPENRLVITHLPSYSLAVTCGFEKSESNYIRALLRTTHWRMEADALVLEGDGNVIVFKTRLASSP